MSNNQEKKKDRSLLYSSSLFGLMGNAGPLGIVLGILGLFKVRKDDPETFSGFTFMNIVIVIGTIVIVAFLIAIGA